MANGDDHPEAAHKHLLDAGILLSQQRPDGAAYLSGYVVECALKTLYLIETQRSLRGHRFTALLNELSAVTSVAGAKTARYVGPATRGVLASALQAWTPEMRYRAPTLALEDAQAWYSQAKNIFQETVHQMSLDGLL